MLHRFTRFAHLAPLAAMIALAPGAPVQAAGVKTVRAVNFDAAGTTAAVGGPLGACRPGTPMRVDVLVSQRSGAVARGHWTGRCGPRGHWRAALAGSHLAPGQAQACAVATAPGFAKQWCAPASFRLTGRA